MQAIELATVVSVVGRRANGRLSRAEPARETVPVIEPRQQHRGWSPRRVIGFGLIGLGEVVAGRQRRPASNP